MTQYMISMSIYGVSKVLSMVRHCGKSKGNKYEFLWFQGAYSPEVMGEGRAEQPRGGGGGAGGDRGCGQGANSQ